MADGTITIDSKLGTKQLEADLKQQEKELAGINKQLSTQEAKMASLEAKAKSMTAAFLETARAMGQDPTDAEIAAAVPGFQQVNAEMLSLQGNIDKTRIKQQALNDKITETKARIAGASKFSGMRKGAEGVANAFKKINKRIASMMSRVLVFSLIMRALRAVVEWFGKVIKTNKEATAAIAKLKGALLTLAQPIIEVILPAFTKFVSVLAKIASAVAGVISSLFGKTTAQSSASAAALYEQTEALEGVGGAAKDAGKQMASFDEINQISNTDTSSGGGGASSTIAPEFNDDGITEDLRVVEDLVLSIAAGLAAWKIASSFTDNMKMIGGLSLSIAGAVALVYFWLDAWNNGVDWTNLIGMIAGVAAVAGGLAIAFGKTAAGIAALVGGIAILVVSIKDMIENGLSLQNTLGYIAGAAGTVVGAFLLFGSVGGAIALIVAGVGALVIGIKEFIATGEMTNEALLLITAGVLALGVAISLLTMNWIPAVIAAVLALVLFVVSRWEEIKAFFANLWEKICEFFSSAWEGIKGIWATVATWFTENVITPIKDFFSPITDFFSKLFEGAWLIIQAVWIVVSSWFNEHVIQPLVEFFQPIIDTIGGIFSRLWEAVKGVWTKVSTWFKEKVIDPIKEAWEIAFEGIKNFAKTIFNGIMGIFENIINFVIDGVNKFLSLFNKAVVWAADIVGANWTGMPLIEHVSLPRLAEGAVLPGGREFLAVLGDQPRGQTNIEAPLETIKQALAEVLAGGFVGGGEQTVILQLDRQTLGKVVYKLNKDETRRIGVRLAEV